MLKSMRICHLYLQLITRTKLQVFYHNRIKLILLGAVNGAEENTIPLKCANEERFSPN